MIARPPAHVLPETVACRSIIGHVNDALGMFLFGEYAPRSKRARAFAAAYVAYLGASLAGLVLSGRVAPELAGLLGAAAALLAAVAVLPLRRSEAAAGVGAASATAGDGVRSRP